MGRPVVEAAALLGVGDRFVGEISFGGGAVSRADSFLSSSICIGF